MIPFWTAHREPRYTVRQYLEALGYRSGDHDQDVRNALSELLQTRGRVGLDAQHDCPECGLTHITFYQAERLRKEGY
jgi:hypothetical protein